MENKVITIKKYQKNKLKNNKMLLIIILFSMILGVFIWHQFVEKQSYLEIEIPESKNIFYNNQNPIASTTAQIASIFEQNESKPILLYLYTSWCSVCSKNFSQINEIAREFQNTDLKVIAISIDKDMDDEKLMNYLNSFGDFYFQPYYLISKEGFYEYLAQRKIYYDKMIPFTALISGNGKIITKFSGTKSHQYLRSKIIKELFLSI